MSVKLFREPERRFVRLIEQLTDANPFLEARQDLEREALGDSYSPFRMGSGELAERWQNAEALTAKSAELLDLVKRRIASRPDKVEVRLYESLLIWVIYHRHCSEMDGLIAEGSRRSRGRGWDRIYDSFTAFWAHYWQPFEGSFQPAYPLHQLYAFMYQIRRAFFHIFRHVAGRGEAAQRMRANIWHSIFTHSPELYRQALYPRMRDIATLVTGPSGSGKELVARAIGLSQFVPFNAGAGRFEEDVEKVFLPVHLAALSETLLEAELFGHQKGAFTGASAPRAGYFEASGRWGTVFLDEIGEASQAIQVKLLRVLQSREFQRLGDTSLRRFSGKVVAATNRSLTCEVRESRFREDLYYRLSADRVQTPSLRELLGPSNEDLELITGYIVGRLVGEAEQTSTVDRVLEVMRHSVPCDHKWPGNFRELEQCVRHILVHGRYRPPSLIDQPDEETEEGSWLVDLRLFIRNKSSV